MSPLSTFHEPASQQNLVSRQVGAADSGQRGLSIFQPSDLSSFPVASAGLLAERALLTRIDRKFLTSRDKVEQFLEALGDDYHILLAGGAGWARYETCYYDTPQFDAFVSHVRGRRSRFKVRVRHHIDRGCSFLEIKEKTNADKTVKARRQRAFLDGSLSDDDRAFIAQHCGLPSEDLRPCVWTNFTRATLVGTSTAERITVDLGLTFEKDGISRENPDWGIIEVKQPRFMHTTPAMKVLRRIGVREQSMSKYCAAVAELCHEAEARARRTIHLRLGRM